MGQYCFSGKPRSVAYKPVPSAHECPRTRSRGLRVSFAMRAVGWSGHLSLSGSCVNYPARTDKKRETHLSSIVRTNEQNIKVAAAKSKHTPSSSGFQAAASQGSPDRDNWTHNWQQSGAPHQREPAKTVLQQVTVAVCRDWFGAMYTTNDHGLKAIRGLG